MWLVKYEHSRTNLVGTALLHSSSGILIDNSRNVKETTFDSLIKAAYLAKKKSPNQNVQIDFEIHVAEDKSHQPSIPSVSDYSVNTDMPSDQRINQKSQEIKEYFANNLHLKMPGKRTLNYMAICRAREPDSAPFTIPTGRVFEELQKADDEELLRNSSLHSFKDTAGALANQMLPAPDSLHSFEDTDSILVRQLQDPQMPMFQIEDSLKETPEYVEVFCLVDGNRVAMKFDKLSLLAALQ